MKGGEKLTIHDIPVDTYVMAMEAEYLGSDGFDTYWRNNPSEKNGFAALLTDGEKITLTCVNERNVGDLVLEKKLTGNDPEWEREFTFNVTLTPAKVLVLEEEIEGTEPRGFRFHWEAVRVDASCCCRWTTPTTQSIRTRRGGRRN